MLSQTSTSAEVGLTSQPEPLGYPSLIDDEADATAEEAAGSIWPAPKRVDEPQVPAGFDPYRSPGYVGQPSDFISWGKEPTPASCCDRHLVDREWMGPGELAYHKSPNHRPCTRDYTRVFRTEFPGRLWFSAEYLVWATTGQSVPVLVTSSPNGTPVADIGVIGNAATTTLFGGDDFNGPMRSGARLTTGFWFTPRQERGIEASWLGLAVAKETLSVSSTGGNPWLAQPSGSSGVVIVPTLTQAQVAALDPNLLEQSIDAQLSTQFGSVDVLYRTNLTVGEDFHRRYLCGGFRYLMLDDRLTVDSSSVLSTGTLGGYPLNGYSASDSFKTLSQFYGGEFGVIEKRWRDRWSLQFLGKVALGASTIGSAISGSTTTSVTADATSDPTVTTSPGGVLAQTTNLGSRRSFFAGMGEIGVTADYAIWSQFRLSVGYSLIYWTTVGRVTDQIDNAANPKHTGNLWTTSFWAQGVNAGLEYQF
ncbi:MAG: BBP7 family outer membrane beta-barrel protein [Pirellulales bacterium]